MLAKIKAFIADIDITSTHKSKNAFKGFLKRFPKDLMNPKGIAWSIPPMAEKYQVFFAGLLSVILLNIPMSLLTLHDKIDSGRSGWVIFGYSCMVLIHCCNGLLYTLGLTNMSNKHHLYWRYWAPYAGEAVQVRLRDLGNPLFVLRDIRQWLAENVEEENWTTKDRHGLIKLLESYKEDELEVAAAMPGRWIAYSSGIIFVFKHRQDATMFKLTFGGQRFNIRRNTYMDH